MQEHKNIHMIDEDKTNWNYFSLRKIFSLGKTTEILHVGTFARKFWGLPTIDRWVDGAEASELLSTSFTQVYHKAEITKTKMGIPLSLDVRLICPFEIFFLSFDTALKYIYIL